MTIGFVMRYSFLSKLYAEQNRMEAESGIVVSCGAFQAYLDLGTFIERYMPKLKISFGRCG